MRLGSKKMLPGAVASQNVSVIVTIRNAGEHLQDCLDALAAQKVDQGIEVILVDNGSTDGSAAVAKGFAQENAGFRFVSQSGTAGAARNAGVKAAKGGYLAFVNAPDLVAPGLYQSMVTVAARSKSPVVVCEALRLCDDAEKPEALLPSQRRAVKDLPPVSTLAQSPQMVFNEVLGTMLVSAAFYRSTAAYGMGDEAYEESFVTFVLLVEADSVSRFPAIGYSQRAENDPFLPEDQNLEHVERRLSVAEKRYHYALEKAVEPEILSRMDLKLVDHDLLPCIDAAADLDDQAAKETLDRINQFIRYWDPYDRLAKLSVMVRQKFDCLERLDLEQLRRVVEYDRLHYGSVQFEKSGRGYRAELPRDIFTVARFGVTADLKRHDPNGSVSFFEVDQDSIGVSGYVCKPRTNIRKGQQSLKAYLVNAVTGAEMPLPIEPGYSKRAKTFFGSAVDSNGQEVTYFVGGAGFKMSIPAADVLSNPKMRGLNFVRVHYDNALEKGFLYLAGASVRAREEAPQVLCATKEGSMRIDLGPFSQLRVVVE